MTHPLLAGVPALPNDICIRKARWSAESQAANQRTDKTAGRQAILAILQEGESYLHALCNRLNKTPNEVSPRCSELKAMGLVETTGKRIDGCAVIRLVTR